MTVAELFAKLRLKVDEESWAKGEAAISGLKGLLAGVGLSAAAARGALEAVIAHTASAALEANKAAQRVGMSRQGFQELDEAAKHSGVEGFEQGMKFLNRAMYEAQRGSHEARKEFRALGVEIGKGSKVDEVFTALVEKFSTMDEGPAKVALAMKMFGRAGNEMLPFLNKGNEGIKEMIEHARKLGLIFSDEDVKAAKAYKLANLDLKMSLEGLERTIGRHLLPEAGAFARAMSEWIAANREWIATGIHKALDLTSAALKRAKTMIEPLIVAVKWIVSQSWAWKAVLVALALVMVSQFGSAMAGVVDGLWKFYEAVKAITAAQVLGAAASIATGILWAGGIALILMAIEELYGWITGDRKTLLGEWLGKFQDFMKYDPSDSNFATGLKFIAHALEWVVSAAGRVPNAINAIKWAFGDDPGDVGSPANMRARFAVGGGAYIPAPAGAGGAPVSVTFGDINVPALPAGATVEDLAAKFGGIVDEKLRGILDPAYEAGVR